MSYLNNQHYQFFEALMSLLEKSTSEVTLLRNLSKGPAGATTVELSPLRGLGCTQALRCGRGI